MFAYCHNNPVNLFDSTGSRPAWIDEFGATANAVFKEAANRLVYSFDIMGQIILSPIKALEASVGLGIGLGAETELNIDGVNVTAGASASITDSIVYENGSFDAQSTSSAGVGVNIESFIDLYYGSGVQHSLFDRNCTCDLWNDPFVDRADCPVNQPIITPSKTIGFSFSLFFIIGIDASVGINLDTWNQELHNILNSSLAYGG